jgi:hypothetical protein
MVDPQATTIEQSYALGQAIARANTPEARNTSFDAFMRTVAKNPLPLTPAENQAVEMAQQRAAISIVGLGNKINAQTGQMLIEEDDQLRLKLRDTIREKVVEAIEERKSPQQLKSDLGWATEDWTRDLNRIAMTEKHSAMETGKADHIASLDGRDADVAVMHSADACPNCINLTTGADGHPRIFKLSELEANGTNVGRKVAEWRAVVGCIHPNCQCNMVRVPAGWGFDEHGDLVPDGPLGTRTDADRLNRGGPEALDLYKAVRDGGQASFAGLSIQVKRPTGAASGWAYGQFAAGPHLHKCLVGAVHSSPAAYIVHTAGPDRLLVGFATLERALTADSEARLLQRGLAAPTGASEVPTAALAAWASRTPARPTMELRRGFAGDSYIDDVQDLDGTGALNDGTLLGEGSHGVNFEFDVPVKKRPRGVNSDPTGLIEFVKRPQESVVVNPVRRTKADYVIQANMPKRGVHVKAPAVTPLSPAQREHDAKVARDGLQHQLAARYGGWVGQDAKFVIQDLAGILKQRETGEPPRRAPVKSKAKAKARGG